MSNTTRLALTLLQITAAVSFGFGVYPSAALTWQRGEIALGVWSVLIFFEILLTRNRHE